MTSYSVGDEANWVGTAHAFSSKVRIARAGKVLGSSDEITCDLADPASGKIVLFAATEREIERMPRSCAWCEHDISGAGDAKPIMHARLPGPDDNWQCSDEAGCDARLAVLERLAGMPPAPSLLRRMLTTGA